MPRRNTLDSTVLDRLSFRPGWARTDLVRRVAAAALALVAVVLFARDAVASDQRPVLVASRDLTPGTTLTAEDVRVAQFSPGVVPDGSLTEPAAAISRTVTGPIRAGEPLTDVRLLSSRLAEAALDVPDARVVPVRLADGGVAGFLREGDSIDVLTVTEEEGTAQVLAERAIVVLVSPEDAGRRGGDRVVLAAMNAEDASRVAAASLVSALTVTLH